MLCCYLDLVVCVLCEMVVVYYCIKFEQVFVGNGFDEVFVYMFQVLFKYDWLLCFFDIMYSFYLIYVCLYGVEIMVVLFVDDFLICVDDYFDDVGGVLFLNLNVLIGCVLLFVDVEWIVVVNLLLVVVIDEVYVDFGVQLVIMLIDCYLNLFVVYMMLKVYLFVGMCVGFVFGDVVLIDVLNCVKDSFNLYLFDWFVQVVVQVVYEDIDYFNVICWCVIDSWVWFMQVFDVFGFEIVLLVVNFVFVCYFVYDVGVIVVKLKEWEIFVWYFWLLWIDQYFCIIVGIDVECDVFVVVLCELLV